MKLSLRNRLLAVALLGLFTCAVSLFGLGKILQMTMAVRTERARELAGAELAAMRRAPAPSVEKGTPVVHTAVLGMRGGYVDSEDAFVATPPELDPAMREG